MRNEELFKEFVKFCESQPEDKMICHDSWSECAVGDFLRHKGLKEIGTTFDTPEIEQIVGGYDEEGVDYNFRKDIGSNKCPHTYGEFSKWLKDYL